MPLDYTIRPVAPADLELVCQHRESMFAASRTDRESLRPMTDAFREWLRPRLADQSYFGWIAESAGQPIAGLGMMILDWPPHPFHPTDTRRGYILNVFVDPNHRRQGIAERLMQLARDEGLARNLKFLVLHATKQGQPLYEKLGWFQTPEMALHLDPSNGWKP